MVIERKQYLCELCKEPYNTIGEAGQCEIRCSRIADYTSLKTLNLSPRTFNALYSANINTINDRPSCPNKNFVKSEALGKGVFLNLN